MKQKPKTQFDDQDYIAVPLTYSGESGLPGRYTNDNSAANLAEDMKYVADEVTKDYQLLAWVTRDANTIASRNPLLVLEVSYVETFASDNHPQLQSQAQVKKTIQELADEFSRTPMAKACETSEGAFGNCKAVNAAFAQILRDNGYRARMVLYRVKADKNKAHPKWTEKPYPIGHYIVQVGDGSLWDFSYRQFDTEAIHPRTFSERPKGSSIALDWKEPEQLKPQYQKLMGKGFPLSEWPAPFRWPDKTLTYSHD